MSISFDSTRELIDKVAKAAGVIAKVGRTGTANYVVSSRAVGDIMEGEARVKKLKSYDIVANPGFSKAKMEPHGYWDSAVGVSGTSGTSGYQPWAALQEPKGQKFTDLDPYGEENWED